MVTVTQSLRIAYSISTRKPSWMSGPQTILRLIHISSVQIYLCDVKKDWLISNV